MNTNAQGLYLTEQDARSALPDFKACAIRAGVSDAFFLYQHPRNKGFGLWPVSPFIPKTYRIIERV
mgnify:CR=1 FL=1